MSTYKEHRSSRDPNLLHLSNCSTQFRYYWQYYWLIKKTRLGTVSPSPTPAKCNRAVRVLCAKQANNMQGSRPTSDKRHDPPPPRWVTFLTCLGTPLQTSSLSRTSSLYPWAWQARISCWTPDGRGVEVRNLFHLFFHFIQLIFDIFSFYISVTREVSEKDGQDCDCHGWWWTGDCWRLICMERKSDDQDEGAQVFLCLSAWQASDW
jgi:hypothetical protein